MRNPNQRILVAEPLGKQGLEQLQNSVQVDVQLNLSRPELLEIIPQYQGLIVRSSTKVDATLLAAGKELVVVGRAGVGVDNIDVVAATEHGITVVNAPTTNIVAAAEHTIALMFALARRVPQAEHSVRAHKWERERFVGIELVGKQLGLVGLGRVGTEVARRAIGLGMEIVAYDPYVPGDRAQQMQVRLVSFPELLASSDFVSLHTPLTRETKQLVGKDEFATMKPGARLINVARGGLVDEGALLAALDQGRLAGAALDVFGHEPPTDSRLLEDERVVLTPHIGGSTSESQSRVSVEIADQVLAVLHGQSAHFAVNAPLIPPTLDSLLKPYVDLAQRLGRFYIQWVGGPLESITIAYRGQLASEETDVLTAAVTKGLVESIHDDRVNLVNARLVAQSHGLALSEHKIQDPNCHENSIAVQARRRVMGTVVQGRPHIVQLDDYAVDFIADGHLLLVRHRDRPGMIGRIGTLLGDADINIAAMQVARDAPRGEAIMVLSLDDVMPAHILEQVCQQPWIEWARALQI